MEKYFPDDFRQKVVEKISTEVASCIMEQIKSAINQSDIERVRRELIDKACYVFCHTGCPHKTDSYNCLKDKCDTWGIFRRIMEE